MLSTHEQLILLAKLAEQADRYDDMREFMDKVAFSETESQKLTLEERKLLSNAYKTISGRLRRSWRTISTFEEKEANNASSPYLHLVRRSKAVVLNQLNTLCHEILEKVEKHLLPSAITPETKVFDYKIIGDYLRYLAESSQDDSRNGLVAKSLEAYKTAWEIAISELSETDPTRLGLALNFSVFYFELLDRRDCACHLAKHAFDAALENLDDLPEEDAGDSIHILQLLKDNLSLWLEQMEPFPPSPPREKTETEVQP